MTLHLFSTLNYLCRKKLSNKFLWHICLFMQIFIAKGIITMLTYSLNFQLQKSQIKFIVLVESQLEATFGIIERWLV